MSVADGLLRTGAHKRALVIGAETFSRILDWKVYARSDRHFVKKFEEETGIAIDYQIVPADQYFNLLRTKLNSGEAPDIFGGQSGVTAQSCPDPADLGTEWPRTDQADGLVVGDVDLGKVGEWNPQFQPDELWLMANPVPGMRIIARRMMSAAEPWIGALIDARS